MDELKNSIFTYTGELKKVDSIIRVEEMDTETYLFLNDGSKAQSVLSIDVLEWELPKESFVRVHSKHLINISYSKKLFSISTHYIELENGEKIPTNQELTQNKTLIKKGKNKLLAFLKKL